MYYISSYLIQDSRAIIAFATTKELKSLSNTGQSSIDQLRLVIRNPVGSVYTLIGIVDSRREKFGVRPWHLGICGSQSVLLNLEWTPMECIGSKVLTPCPLGGNPEVVQFAVYLELFPRVEQTIPLYCISAP